MKPDIKAQWLKALRSGDYLQGKQRLRSELNKKVFYCCLGVLCDIGFGTWEEKTKGIISYPDPDYIYKIELKTSDMFLLAKMNDDGKSFDEIADWIEENL